MQSPGEGQESRGQRLDPELRRGEARQARAAADDPTQVELELAVEKNPSIADNQVAEATIWTKGPVLRAREASSDMRASIDQLVEKLERQVKRYRDKRRATARRRAARAQRPSRTPRRPPRSSSLEIVKTKQFTLEPMTPEEAVLQLELVGHDFFVFRTGDSRRSTSSTGGATAATG